MVQGYLLKYRRWCKVFTLFSLLIFSFLSSGQKKDITGTAGFFTEVESGPVNVPGSNKVIDDSFTGYNVYRYSDRPLKTLQP